ncbi:MAG TPA: ORF6N domain-containing protein [Candidatus Mediterraneibacter intestinigallinarum]|nr:ORF6N domain-containing protein [Candidatus Mediterraneibacter intestinigallinarum]
MQLQLPETVEVKGIRVLTTRQLAQAYETTRQIISYNFNYNKHRYVEGKHYIALEGNELRAFKASHEIHDNLKYAHIAYFWTEKGALLHAKSLNTDKAWEVYDYLVDYYFRVEEQRKVPVTVETKQKSRPNTRKVVDVPENPQILKAIQKIKNDLICMNVLLDDCKMYVDEDTYVERRKSAAEVVHIIVKDWTSLLNLKPKLVEKYY